MSFPLFTKPEYVVIGIHGLQNKPPKRLLRKWWIAAIKEGFERAGYPFRPFAFELVYWAHHLYSKPLSLREKRAGHPRFLDEPYIPSDQKKGKPKRKSLPFFLRPFVKKTLDTVFLGSRMQKEVDVIAENLLAQSFPDLALYYTNERVFSKKIGIRDLLRAELRSVIEKYPNSKILLIAHSMGSIITFDVLSDNLYTIDTLVTVGSPVGLPLVRKRFAQERNILISDKDMIHTPESIRKGWFNLADTKDMVAFDSYIADNYSKNSFDVAPNDKHVFNDYVYNNCENHHNILGYLRTPEMTKILHDFIVQQPLTFWQRVKKELFN